MTSQVTRKKPLIRAPPIWKKRMCQCRQAVFLCFGIPLLPPSAVLLGFAFMTQPSIGVFHICGFVLIFVSLVCITTAIVMSRLHRLAPSTHINKVHKSDPEGPVLTIPRPPRPPSSSSVSSGHGNSGGKLRMVKLSSSSLVAESELPYRPRKKRKRKHNEKSKTILPPVKEEDGRARFEQTLQDRERDGTRKMHKRTKSESRKGFEECMPQAAPPKLALTKKHLRMLGLYDNQGSEENLQMKRSLSMSDIGDSASERLSVDFPDTPSGGRRDPPDTGSVTARPVLVHTTASRIGVRASRFASVL
ncbi:uncharacterized protein LOC124281406 [Haliotis rubra]|uniref:uncharacterized protein LOC124281406 n=1 Tax=Haliotis rubra TaxID=36100 RepID=UPI001EE5480A|nr:uncharacterized protein LOC124281406 [Haliotis rubra]